MFSSRSQSLAKADRGEKRRRKEAAEKEKLLQVFVSEPYLELATGPGRGYPVFHVVEREESVDVLYPPHGLVQGAHEQGVEGWARARDMRRTKLADGSPFVFNLGDRAGFTTHDWEIGIGGGDYGGANLITAYGAYSLTDNMKVELTLSQFLGNASNGYKAEAGLTHVIVPGVAPLAVPRAGHRRRVHRAARDDRAARTTARTRRPTSARASVFISPGAFSSAPTIAGTRSSRAAMTMRSWKNGKS